VTREREKERKKERERNGEREIELARGKQETERSFPHISSFLMKRARRRVKKKRGRREGSGFVGSNALIVLSHQPLGVLMMSPAKVIISQGKL